MAYYDVFILCIALLVPIGELVKAQARNPSRDAVSKRPTAAETASATLRAEKA